jgi:hypothetical protein
VVEVLGVHRRAATLQIREIESAARKLPDGRGAHLRSLILHAVERFDEQQSQFDRELDEITSAHVAEDVAVRLRAVLAHKHERLSQQLTLVYYLLNMYSDSVGRTDVPIGLQHLLGGVLGDIVAQPSDPIVHPDPQKMYSTKDLVDLLDELLARVEGPRLRDTYTGPHPIVFNLPGLDPSNALLSPVIAHEVAHTAVEASLRAELGSRVDSDVQDLLRQHLADLDQAGMDKVTLLFRAWCGEMICDAVALATAGPAFVLAFASFAPPGALAAIDTHPPVPDRIAFHLQMLDELGWTPTLASRLTTVHAWLSEVGSSPLLLGNDLEAFLRAAMSRVVPDIIEIARKHVTKGLDPVDTESVLDSLVKSISRGIPNVEVDDQVAEPWQIILAGWIAAIDSREPAGEQLLVAAADQGLSALLIKSLELSSIVKSWREHERPGS